MVHVMIAFMPEGENNNFAYLARFQARPGASAPALGKRFRCRPAAKDGSVRDVVLMPEHEEHTMDVEMEYVSGYRHKEVLDDGKMTLDRAQQANLFSVLQQEKGSNLLVGDRVQNDVAAAIAALVTPSSSSASKVKCLVGEGGAPKEEPQQQKEDEEDDEDVGSAGAAAACSSSSRAAQRQRQRRRRRAQRAPSQPQQPRPPQRRRSSRARRTCRRHWASRAL
jgi:hypothetical protein